MDYFWIITLFFFNVYFLIKKRNQDILEVVFRQVSYIFFLHFFITIILLTFNIFSFSVLCVIVTVLDSLLLLYERKKNYPKKSNLSSIFFIFFLVFMLLFVTRKSEDIRTNSDMGMYFERYSAFFHGWNGKYVTLKEKGTINDYVDKQLIADVGLGIIDSDKEIKFAYQGLQTWPTVMIVFGKIWGWERGTIALTVFYLLAITSIYLFFSKVIDNGYEKWCAVVLYALSPIIIYLAKATFSECIFDAALLIGLFFISQEKVDDYIYGALWIGVGGFIHISMFLYIFPFIFSLIFLYWKSNKIKYLRIHIIIAIMHIFSLFYCMNISKVYSTEQLKRFAFISDDPYIIIFLFVILEFLSIMISIIFKRNNIYIKTLIIELLDLKWKTLAFIMATIIIIGGKYYANIICMTNSLPVGDVTTTWKLRSEYLGTGIKALSHVNFFNFLQGTAGLSLPFVFYHTIKRNIGEWQKALYLILFFSMFIYTFVQVDNPTNYYASRYYAPVIIPLICILVASFLNKKSAIIFMAFSIVFNLRYDVSFVDNASFEGQIAVYKLADNTVPNDSVVVLDSNAGELGLILRDNLRKIKNCYVYSSKNLSEVLRSYDNEPIYYITPRSISNQSIDGLYINKISLLGNSNFYITYNLGGIEGKYLIGEMPKYNLQEFIYQIND